MKKLRVLTLILSVTAAFLIGFLVAEQMTYQIMLNKIKNNYIKIVDDEYYPDDESVLALTKTLYGECRGVNSLNEKKAVAWCVLNRVDNDDYPDTVLGVVSQPKQFAGYENFDNIVQYEWSEEVFEELRQISIEVLIEHHNNVNRILPNDYIYFVGDGTRNYFSNTWGTKQEMYANSIVIY